jgi:hypothetical protein
VRAGYNPLGAAARYVPPAANRVTSDSRASTRAAVFDAIAASEGRGTRQVKEKESRTKLQARRSLHGMAVAANQAQEEREEGRERPMTVRDGQCALLRLAF